MKIKKTGFELNQKIISKRPYSNKEIIV